MERKDKYYTMGQYVHDVNVFWIDISVEDADIVRSDAIQIAADNNVSIRFKRRYKSGPRNGKSTIQLPIWVWDQAFENQKHKL